MFYFSDVPVVLLDFLSMKISPKETVPLCMHLLKETQMVETPRFFINPSDTIFRILHRWTCLHPHIDHFEELKTFFRNNGREDLIEEMESFSVDSYVYSGHVTGSERIIDNSDISTVANNLSGMYYHVVRFLGLKPNTIYQVEADHVMSMKDQICKCLTAVPQLTRQSLCNALKYVGHCDIIAALIAKWKAKVS